MDKSLAYQIISLIITILVMVLTYFVIPWLRSKGKIGLLSFLRGMVSVAVQAAEQLYNEPGMGITKKDYVLQFLLRRGIKLEEDELDALIEAAVYNLNQIKSLPDNIE